MINNTTSEYGNELINLFIATRTTHTYTIYMIKMSNRANYIKYLVLFIEDP